MRRRQFLSVLAAVSVPLAGCAAPRTSTPTPLSNPEETVVDGRPTLVYRHDGERLLTFSLATVDVADNVSLGDLTPFTVRVERSEQLAFDSVRYAFTTGVGSQMDLHPAVYVGRMGTTEFPAYEFVEDGPSNATVLAIDEFESVDYPEFSMRFLLWEDELPRQLTVAARIVVSEQGGRRYVAEPSQTVELTRP